MEYYRIDEETIWEPTGRIVVHKGTLNIWVCRVYKETKKGKLGSKEVEGPPIYMDQLSTDQRALILCIGNAQDALMSTLPIVAHLTKCKVSQKSAFNTIESNP